jgi:hypothetical protein
MSTSRRELDAGVRWHLNCPRCGLSIVVRPQRAAIRHCPQCVARSRMLVELFSSTLSADVLYDENSLPRVSDEAALSSATAGTATAGERLQRAQVVDKLGRAAPLALLVKRPMAVSSPAVDGRAASLRSRPRLAACPKAGERRTWLPEGSTRTARRRSSPGRARSRSSGTGELPPWADRLPTRPLSDG